MGQRHYEIDADLQAFIASQQMFFVATAPSGAGGHINVSPKGLDTLRVIDSRTVAYLDHVGSGAETIAHLRDNGRIVIMFCAFEGTPKILRLHGQGEVIEPEDSAYGRLRPLFADAPSGRSIIRVSIERVSDSCGFGVPRYKYEGQRPQLADWVARKGEDGLVEYQAKKNRTSLDGLPALRWVEQIKD